MVGRQALDLEVGVRIPAPEEMKKIIIKSIGIWIVGFIFYGVY